MVSRYRQFKEAVGASNPDSVGGRLARLKDELKTTLADEVEKAKPAIRPTLRQLHEKAGAKVASKDLEGAAALVSQLKQQLLGNTSVEDDRRQPTNAEIGREYDVLKRFKGQPVHDAFAAVDGLKPKNLEDWDEKIARCTAFIATYGKEERAATECAQVRDIILPYARKQRAAQKIAEEDRDRQQKQQDEEARIAAEFERLADQPFRKAFEDLDALKPTTIEGWSRKIACCEAFLKRFAKDHKGSRECDYVSTAFLPNALKQRTQLEAEDIYKQSLANKGDHPLRPRGNPTLDDEKMRVLMDETALNEAEILAIRVFTDYDYEDINPVVANQKDKVEFTRGQPVVKGQPAKVPWLDTYLKGRNSRGQFSERELEDYKKQILDSAAAHAAMLRKAVPKLPAKSATVYRGQRMTKQEYAALLKKGKVDIETFQSNSTSLATARSFAFAPPGTSPPAADKIVCVITESAVRSGRDVGAISVNPKEDELMLLPGTELRIQGQPIEESEADYSGDPHPVVPAQQFFYVRLAESSKM